MVLPRDHPLGNGSLLTSRSQGWGAMEFSDDYGIITTRRIMSQPMGNPKFHMSHSA
jgi:hypothetical protein